MIIVILMLTVALSGCASSDEQESLSGAVLSGDDLSGADLSGADLSGADLTGANLDYVNGKNLQECPAYLPTNWQCVNNNLVGPFAILNYAYLSDAYLYGANPVSYTHLTLPTNREV